MTDYHTLLAGHSELAASTGSGVRVAVMDSGLYAAHPDFYATLGENVFNVLPGSDAQADINTHGTHIGGLIGARGTGAESVKGVAPACELVAIKVIADNGAVSASDLAAGLSMALDKNVDIVNLSLNIPLNRMDKVKPLLDVMLEKGIHIIAAAGNNITLSETGQLYSPASYANIISVGAVSKAFYAANPGFKFNRRLDFVVEETDLLSCSTPLNKLYKTDKGCSQSTALVTGLAALLLSSKGKLRKEELRNSLVQLASDMDTLSTSSTICLLKPF